MTITLELTPQEADHVRHRAQLRGEDVPTFVKNAALRVSDDTMPPADSFAARLAQAAREASASARADLHARGINAAFLQQGELHEELPDGTVRRLARTE